MSRVALVTGAGKGIGAACARALSDAGHRVALLARSQDDLDALAQELPGETHVVPTHVTDPAALDAAFAQTKSLITRELDMPIGSAMELDAMTQALLMTTHDHAEFHAAFNEKRPPEWTGR